MVVVAVAAEAKAEGWRAAVAVNATAKSCARKQRCCCDGHAMAWVAHGDHLVGRG